MNDSAGSVAPTFYIHDYETFGLSPSMDRPAQFAGIRTDQDFNIIGEPLVIYCKPPVDYLPQPEACLVTGITPQKAMKDGLCEADFMRLIHEQFATPGTCVMGFNNIAFDDEVTRYALYRNFYDPYAYSWQNGNSRWDILNVVRACYALRPEGISWPVDDKGAPRFRLEMLSASNGISHANAHDALSDVIATIEMAKLVKKAQPKLFSYLFDLRNKNKVKALIDVVSIKPLVHVSSRFPATQGCMSWVAPLGWHPTNQNAVMLVDLSQDISPLLELNSDEICERLFTPKSELGDLARIPVSLAHINKCPVLAPASTLAAERAQQLGIDKELCLKNLAMLRAHPEVRQKLADVYSQEFTGSKNTDPDTQLYDGFFSQADKSTMDLVRATPPDLLGYHPFKFNDPRLPEMLFRYRARNWPHTLSEVEQKRWGQHCTDYFSCHLQDYGLHLEELVERNKGKEREFSILRNVYEYLVSL